MKKSVILALSGLSILLVCGVFLIDFEASGEEQTPTYTGPRKCQACHIERHRLWERAAHSHAGSSLTDEQIATGKDASGRACADCHLTGVGKDTGFVSKEKTPEFANVGCESCHGPGSEHIWIMTKAKLDEVEVEDKKIDKSIDCDDCHNPHVSYKALFGKKEGE